MLNFITGLAAIVPFTIVISYYYKTKFLDFLLLAMFFLFAIIGSIVSGLYSPQNIFLKWSVSIFFWLSGATFLMIVIIRMRWEKFPIWAYFLVSLLPLIALFSIIDQGRTALFGSWFLSQQLFNLFGSINRIIQIYVFFTISLPVDTKRVKWARNFWIIQAIFGFISQFSTLYITLIAQIPLSEFELIHGLVPSLAILLANIIFVIFHILIPEAVLISKVQTIRALKFYKIAKLRSQEFNENAVLGFDRLKSYINKIPKEIMNDVNLHNNDNTLV